MRMNMPNEKGTMKQPNRFLRNSSSPDGLRHAESPVHHMFLEISEVSIHPES
jgi:hypothetical protein